MVKPRSLHLAAVTLLAALLAACGAPQAPQGELATVTVRLGHGGPTGPAHAAEPGLAPQGVPVDPVTGGPGVEFVELRVFSGGQPVRFDAAGNAAESGDEVVPLSGGQVTLHLPHGTYDFVVLAEDGSGNELADGASLGVVVDGDETVRVELRSFLGSAALVGPKKIVPNMVIDVALLVHPPGREDLVVPTDDFDVSFTASADLLEASKRGVRLVVECEEIVVSAQVTDHRDPATAVLPDDLVLPAVEVCESYAGGLGLDLVPPYLEVTQAPAEHRAGVLVQLAGTVFDAQTGVARVSVYDGPVHLGDATVDDSQTPHTWTFTFTPDQDRAYALTLVAADGAGNETRHLVEAVALPEDIVYVTAGGRHTCGLTSAGAAYCWGYGTLGQLGDGTGEHSDVPRAVAGGHRFTALTAGGNHTCGVTDAGEAYCWGYGGSGQLGHGAFASSDLPVKVSGPAFTAIDAGESHTCALTAEGDAYCWGYGANGQLGNGSAQDSALPALVEGGAGWTAVSAGGNHTCGTKGSPGSNLYCWGAGSSGQLGKGPGPGGAPSDELTPRLVFSASEPVLVTTGYYHTCLQPASGGPRCAGDGGGGRLGYGGNSNRYEFTVANTPLAFSELTAGRAHTCGITAAGAAYCWGDGSSGQVGDGQSNGTNLVPVAVQGPAFTQVSAGAEHTCGVATDGKAYCWGRGQHGRLGTGGDANSVVPVPVVTAQAP